jgi:cytochrome c biogenesis protein CcmG/thiol:disulfide interchange protein DsbE
MSAIRFSLIVAVFGMFFANSSSVMAEENPYPSKWFWGTDDQRAVHDAMIGQPAPALALTDWINGEQTAETLKGKIVVVDLWATWCGPCIGSIPHNNEMAEQYAKDGVVVVGVCGSQSGQENMEQVVKDHDIKYPVGKDSTYEVAKAWNTMWWPTYAVVDRNNIVRAVGLKPSYIDDVVDSVLVEQPYTESDDAEQGGESAEVDE